MPPVLMSKKLVAAPIERLAINPLIRLLLDPKIMREAEVISTTNNKVLAGDHHGFVQSIGSPATIAAECYKIIRASMSVSDADVQNVLSALDTLLNQIKDIKKYKMPLNTTRVMIAILRDAVDHSKDRVKLFESLQLFKLALGGQPNSIRQLLKKLNMIELPEIQPLKDIGIAWDDGVYDSSTTGKKSTVQLIMDAYIKGLSSVTISHTNSMNLASIKLGIEAGKILGINVRFSLEFSAGPAGKRDTYIIYLPGCNTAEDYKKFMDSPELQFFFNTLNEHSSNKNDMLMEQVDRFNQFYLRIFNQGFEKLPELCMKKLNFEQLAGEHTAGGLSRIHLGSKVEKDYQQLINNRLAYLQAEIKRNEVTPDQLSKLKIQVEEVKKSRHTLNTYNIVDTYFSKKDGYDYNAPLADLQTVLKTIQEKGGQIVLAQPLGNGIAKAADAIIDNFPYVNGIEVYNTRLYFNNDTPGVEELTKLVTQINQRDIEGLKKHLTDIYAEAGIPDKTDAISTLINHLQQSKFFLYPVFRSDSNGYKPAGTPGMGFYLPNLLTEYGMSVPKNQSTLPISINMPYSANLSAQTTPISISKQETLPAAYKHAGLAMQNINTFEARPETEQTEENKRFLTISRIFRYPNPWIRNPLMIGLGFIAATAITSGSIGLPLTVAWYAGSLLNYYISDMVGSNHNYNPKNWDLSKFNINNASTSLFYTGFGIALLKLTDNLLQAYLGPVPGFLASYAMSLGLLVAKGIFEYCKQLAMGADTAKAKWGFGRMLIAAVPFTILESTLSLYMPRVVQVKIWDELIKHIISISLKQKEFSAARTDDYNRILSDFSKISDDDKTKIKFMDILYIWKELPGGAAALQKLLLQEPGDKLDHLLNFAKRDDLFSIFNSAELDPKYKIVKEKLMAYLPQFKQFLGTLQEKQTSKAEHIMIKPPTRITGK